MTLDVPEELSMILPLPAGVAEDAVSYIDLSSYPEFFLI